MRVRDAVSFVAFAVMIALGIGYFGSLGLRIGAPSQRTDVSMVVADVNGLVVGSNVLLRGVPIGKVNNIDVSVGGATIDFYIGDQWRVPIDSDVRLDNLSALGESYIALLPRTQSGPYLHDGQRIAAKSIVQPPSISELATSVVRVLNQLDPGALERIVREADTALPDPKLVLPNLSRTSMLLRNTAAGMNGQGQVLLDNFQTLLRNAGWLGPLLAEFTPQVNSFSPSLRSAVSSLPAIVHWGAPRTLSNFNDFLDRIQNFVETNGGDLIVVGDAIQPHIKGIAGALLNFDTGQILANVLKSLPEDGTVTLHVGIPAN